MVSEAMLKLEAERIDIRCYQTKRKIKPLINIDMQKQLEIGNICVWEIDDGINKIYKISMPGLAQNNYNDRVMIKGKQPERHVIGQYASKKVTLNKYPIIGYLTEEELTLYLGLLGDNNIRGCVEYLRKIEERLNLCPKTKLKEPVKVLVKKVKKGN